MAAVCKGDGYVYILKEKDVETYVKVGCTDDINRRLREVRRQHPDAELVDTFETSYMMKAEQAVKEALEDVLNMEKATFYSKDWYILPNRIPQYILRYVVESEVNQVNLSEDLDKATKKSARLMKQKTKPKQVLQRCGRTVVREEQYWATY